MLDHVGFPVSNLAKSRAFYVAAFAPLGVNILMEITAEQTGNDAHIGFGSNGKPWFWIGTGDTLRGRLHVCFSAPSRQAVDAFYAVAIAAGGKDNGAPGIRAHYHPHYYGAFVIDPDGHNIEAVCHLPA